MAIDIHKVDVSSNLMNTKSRSKTKSRPKTKCRHYATNYTNIEKHGH